ncbi:unnamed protein product [Schistosoma turkestanicum]|nr:unnamed protein product [Schistosoma turkestanicum]
MYKTHLDISIDSTSSTTVNTTSMNPMSTTTTTTKVRFIPNLCNGHLLSSISSMKTNSSNLYDAPSSSASSTGDYSTSSEISNVSHALKNFTIGDRVFLNKSKQHGTIAYIGPTHFSSDDLVGVVLDSSSGKHDGSINGIRYFQCPAKRGLFCPITDLFPIDQKNIISKTRIKSNNDYELLRNLKCRISDKRVSSSSVCNHFDRYDRKRHSFRLPKTTTDDVYAPETGKFQRSLSERVKSTGKLWKDSEFSECSRIIEPYDIQKEMKIHRCNTLPGNSNSHLNNTSPANLNFIRAGSLSRIKQNHELKKSNTISEMTSISASRLYDQRRTNNGLNNNKFKLFNSIYAPNQSLFNVQFRNSLRLIKLKNKLNKYSTGQLPINFNDKDCINMTNNLSFYSQTNQFSNENELFLMNNVINCAQERLSDLQNQVLQYHSANVKLSKQLTFVKIRQQDILCKLGERQKDDVFESQQTNRLQKQRIHNIKQKLFQEYEKLQNLAHDFHSLKITNVNIISNIANNNNQSNSYQTTLNNCYQKKDSVVLATVHSLEESNNNTKNPDHNHVHGKEKTCNNNSDNLESQLDNTVNVQEIIELRKQKLLICEAYQCHYQNIFKKLTIYQQLLNDQICEMRECDITEDTYSSSRPIKSVVLSNFDDNTHSLHSFNSEYDTKKSLKFHKSICKEHEILLKEAKNQNYKLSMELSVLNAELRHLISRPERQLFNYLKQLESSKATNDNLHRTTQNLEEQIARNHKELEDAKNKLNKEGGMHLTLMRMNLRIHQLKQMQIKVHSLQNDQCISIKTKEKELTEAINKMNLLSESWANERQAKIETIQKLRENLKLLSDESSKVCITNKTIQTQHADRTNNNSVQISDTHEPLLPYSLFSALCKEIRRLQSRSVTLVEALDLLSTGSYNAEKLEQIKNLVFSLNQTKNTYTTNWKNTSLNNVGTNIRRNMDTRSFNTVRSIKLRNSETVSANAHSPKRYSGVPAASPHSKHITISDNRRQRTSSCKNSSDGNLKNLSIQESTNEKTVYPNPPTGLQIEKSVSPLQQQHKQRQDPVQEEKEQFIQQQQLYYHYSLPISFSPRVQRRPVSFYLSRSVDKFINSPIPEADEEQTDDDEDSVGEGEDEDEEENEKRNENVKKEQDNYKTHYDDHIGSYNNEMVGVEISKEMNTVLISNPS